MKPLNIAEDRFDDTCNEWDEDWLGKGLHRWHVFTDKGRKVKWARSAEEARRTIEKHGFNVRRVVEQPDPLKDINS